MRRFGTTVLKTMRVISVSHILFCECPVLLLYHLWMLRLPRNRNVRQIDRNFDSGGALPVEAGRATWATRGLTMSRNTTHHDFCLVKSLHWTPLVSLHGSIYRSIPVLRIICGGQASSIGTWGEEDMTRLLEPLEKRRFW